jgi:hypothetical protein
VTVCAEFLKNGVWKKCASDGGERKRSIERVGCGLRDLSVSVNVGRQSFGGEAKVIQMTLAKCSEADAFAQPLTSRARATREPHADEQSFQVSQGEKVLVCSPIIMPDGLNDSYYIIVQRRLRASLPVRANVPDYMQGPSERSSWNILS